MFDVLVVDGLGGGNGRKALAIVIHRRKLMVVDSIVGSNPKPRRENETQFGLLTEIMRSGYLISL